MKHAVSVSLGAPARDADVEVSLLGETVRLQRIGTDGDVERAARLFRDLDGKVDAFGVGGALLGVTVDGRSYPLRAVRPMVRFVRRTPLVDGSGLSAVLESRLAAVIVARLGAELPGRRVLVTAGAERWDMARSFARAGFDCCFGDLMFALKVPVALRSEAALRRAASVLMPLVRRMPIERIFPVGRGARNPQPRFARWYRWAAVIAGNCHYITRHMPARLDGKIVCTNTTTPDDVERFRGAGVRHLVTSSPVIAGRTFGSNALEAVLVALRGDGHPLARSELAALADATGLEPTIRRLDAGPPT